MPPTYIAALKIDQASTSAVTVTVETASARSSSAAATTTTATATAAVVAAAAERCACASEAESISLEVVDGRGKSVAWATTRCCEPTRLKVASPQLWSPTSPHLYDLWISLGSGDAVASYFGLRTVRAHEARTPGPWQTTASPAARTRPRESHEFCRCPLPMTGCRRSSRWATGPRASAPCSTTTSPSSPAFWTRAGARTPRPSAPTLRLAPL